MIFLTFVEVQSTNWRLSFQFQFEQLFLLWKCILPNKQGLNKRALYPMNFEVLNELKEAKLWALERLSSPQMNLFQKWGNKTFQKVKR